MLPSAEGSVAERQRSLRQCDANEGSDLYHELGALETLEVYNTRVKSSFD